VPLHLGQTADRLHQRRLERLHIDAGARQHDDEVEPSSCCNSASSRCCGSMIWLSWPIARLLGIGQRLLELGRQFVQTHAAIYFIAPDRTIWLLIAYKKAQFDNLPTSFLADLKQGVEDVL
jgi:hypothetical protein